MVGVMRKIKKLTVSNSAIQDFISCPYAFYKKHVARQSLPEDSLAADLGSAIHKFIEEFCHAPNQDIDKLLRATHKDFKLPAFDFGSYPHFATICKSYLKQYFKLDGKDFLHPPMARENGELLLEVKLEAPIDEEQGLYVSGTIDRIAQTPGGKVVAFDTKTTSGVSYWTKNGSQKVHLLPQLTHYSYLMIKNGLKPDGAVIDLISTNKRFPGFQRIETKRSDEIIAQWFADTKFQLTLMKQCIENETFPRVLGDPCMAYKGCPHLRNCMFPKDPLPNYVEPSYKGLFIEYE
jgi:RecB family exonuclease